MSFCNNCGSMLEDGCAFCTNCGAPQGAAPEAAPVMDQDVLSTITEMTQEPQVVEAAPATLPLAAKIMGIISMVCGILSLVTCFVGWEFAIPALILSGIANKKSQGLPNPKAKIGKITGIIGLPLSIIAFIVYIAIIASAAMEGASYSYYGY